MRRIRLTATEQAQLDQIFKTTTDRRLRDRCQAVLMASRGRKRKIIAQDLGVHRTTVRLWLKQYQERGLAGLPIQWAPGQPGRIPETLAPTIQRWVQEGPQGCGLDRANWTYEELATHLYQNDGHRGQAHRHAGLLSTPCHAPLSADVSLSAGRPREAAGGTGRTGGVKKKRRQGQCVLLSQDDACFPFVPTLRTTLGVKGHRPLVGTWDNKEQVYCFAALNLVTGQLTTRLLEQPTRSRAKLGRSKQQRLQAAFVAHLQDIGIVWK